MAKEIENIFMFTFIVYIYRNEQRIAFRTNIAFTLLPLTLIALCY